MPSVAAIWPMRARSVRRPSTGFRSILKSPAVEHHALGSVKGEGEAARHRVRHRDELDLERADLAALTVADRHEGRLLPETSLVQAVAGEAEREARAVDRGVDVAHQ